MGSRLSTALDSYRDVGPLCLRAAIGVIFLAHGSQKLFVWGLGATAQGFAQMGFQPGIVWASLTAATEFLGGLAVLVGFSTRLAAFLLGMVMLVAIFKVHLPYGFFLNWMSRPGVGHGIEYNLSLIGGCVALLFGGPGRYSIDAKRCGCEESCERK